MTMVTNAKTVPAGRFKAKCLALLDEVAATGRPLVVTKRGKPVAKVVPLEEKEVPSLRGSILWAKDLISPIEGKWDAQE